MIQLTGYIDVPLDRRDEVLAALPEHVRLTKEEPGNLSFEVFEDPNHKGRLVVSETYVDQPALEAHRDRAGKSIWAEITQGIPRNFEIKEIDG